MELAEFLVHLPRLCPPVVLAGNLPVPLLSCVGLDGGIIVHSSYLPALGVLGAHVDTADVCHLGFLFEAAHLLARVYPAEKAAVDGIHHPPAAVSAVQGLARVPCA